MFLPRFYSPCLLWFDIRGARGNRRAADGYARSNSGACVFFLAFDAFTTTGTARRASVNGGS